MLQLFYHPMSAPSRAVRVLLGEYKIGFSMTIEPEWAKREEFLALNPAGVLPVLLTEEKFPLAGVNVIFEYIDEVYSTLQNQNFFPENVIERAEVRRLVNWFSCKFNDEVVKPIAKERVLKREMPTEYGGGSPDSTILRLARTNIRPHMNYIEWLLSSKDWIAGSALSCADFMAAAALSILDYLDEIDWNAYLNTQEWYRKIKSRPSFKQILSDKIKGLAASSQYADLDF